MPVTIDDVKAALMPDEPQYDKAVSGLGRDALPHLRVLMEGSDAALATKAVYLASMLDADDSSGAVRTAALSNVAVVRVAAAGAARHLADHAASDVLTTLLDDGDVGVRKVALKSIPAGASAELMRKVEALSQNSDLHPELRELSHGILRRRADGR